MRLLVVSHACVVAANRKVYAATGADVRVVVPDRWVHEYAEGAFPPQPPLDGVVPLPVVRPGSVPLHAYLRTTVAGADACYVEEEPYSVAGFQWARTCVRAGVPFAFYSAQNLLKRYPLPFRMSERYVHRHASAALVVSDEVAATLRARGYGGPVHRVPLAVNTVAFAPGAFRRGGRTVGFAGRLVPEKGVRVLLDAVRSVPGARLLVVGSGPLADECRAAGAEVRTGVAHADVPAHLRDMDVLAVPSLTTPGWKEQFGRVVVEALACGVPVVTSDSGELPVLVADTGGGVVVPEGSAAALGAALRAMFDDPGQRAAYGEAGLLAVEAAYSTKAVGTRIGALLRSIA